MSITLGCIADDYTGASDLANTLTRNGMPTLQVQGVPSGDLDLAGVTAVVVALKTRSVAAEDAVAQSLAADAWLRAAGARHIMFKICSTFDSTDQGNIGPVMDALRTVHGDPIVPVCPAFPETGRTVFAGHLFVGHTLLSESALRDHPLNPMHDANLVRLLSAQSVAPVGLADYASVDAGPASLNARLDAGAAMGSVIVDAVSERHLETLGEVAAARPLSVGASGLGLGLARALRGEVRQQGAGTGLSVPRAPGPCAMIAGSCSQATLAQIERAGERFPVLRLDGAEMVRDRDIVVAQALGWAATHLAVDRDFLIASSASRAKLDDVQSRFGVEHAARGIEAALAAIAMGLFERGVRRFAVAGGETSGAIVDRLGIGSFLIGAELAPGVPVIHAHAVAERVSLALKSGNFGGPDFFADAVAAMRE